MVLFVLEIVLKNYRCTERIVESESKSSENPLIYVGVNFAFYFPPKLSLSTVLTEDDLFSYDLILSICGLLIVYNL